MSSGFAFINWILNLPIHLNTIVPDSSENREEIVVEKKEAEFEIDAHPEICQLAPTCGIARRIMDFLVRPLRK